MGKIEKTSNQGDSPLNGQKQLGNWRVPVLCFRGVGPSGQAHTLLDEFPQSIHEFYKQGSEAP